MFVAVYWWRVHPGKEEQFVKAWTRGTDLIREIYGSYGSRLHRDGDGRYVGYAEWPDKATWQKAFDLKMVYDEPATRDADPIFTMEVISDRLATRNTDAIA